MTIRIFFPTLLHAEEIEDEGLRADLATAAWTLSEEDEAGNTWCDTEGYDGYTSYASLDDLPGRFPCFAQLKTHLDAQALRMAEALAWDMDGHTLDLDAMWVNILGEGGSHSGHIHPGSVISGTFYVEVPGGAGRLKLEDPRLDKMMAAPPVKSDAPDVSRRFVYVAPKPGQSLMWESWMRHEVVAGRTQEARISVSFNYALGPAPEVE